MTTSPSSSGSSAHQRGLELATQGNHQEALACFHQHLMEHPGDAEALNDAGAVLYALRRFDEAARNFRRAIEILGPAATQTLVNLIEALLAADQAELAFAIFDDLAAAGVLTCDLANRTAMKLLERGRSGQALAAMERSLAISPQQEDIPPIVAKLREGRPKIALLSGERALENLDDIRAFLEARFQVRTVHCGPDQDAQRAGDAIDWCDIVWIDGCPTVLAPVSARKGRCRIVCRLSLADAMSPLIDHVAWENIAALVVHGGKPARQALLRCAPASRKARRILEWQPCLDVARIAPGDRPRGKTLAWVAGGQEPQDLALLLQCFHDLRAQDPEYRLHVAGVFADGERSWRYLEHMAARMGLGGAIVFDGWQEDLPLWLRDKDFLVCTAVSDGRRGDILQAMAAGVKPVVHAFPGSEEFLPPQCLFSTVEEFGRSVLQGPCDRAEYRQFVTQRFSLRDQLRTIEGLLAELEAELIESAASRSPRPTAGARS